MGKFISEHFMLSSDAAQQLYHEHAAKMPIIDYHCHLDPAQIASNHCFSSITEAWLGGDHYKWRAMRANGVEESFITGEASDYEKFEKWAATLQRAMRNPLYHWTHLELAQTFGIDTLLNPTTAADIYARCNELLSTDDFRAQGLMERSHVEVVCTTDDPIDSLEHHRALQDSSLSTRVLPTWRADRVMNTDSPEAYRAYIDSLERVCDMEISTYEELLEALAKRHDYFAQMGCRLSDHGLESFPAADYTESELFQYFGKLRSGEALNSTEALKFRSGVLHDLAVMDHEKGWTQQFHIGPLRNTNSRMFRLIGADTGYDALGDQPCAESGHRFLDRLASTHSLTKTILYNLNPKDNEVLCAMAGSFNEAPTPAKVQFGAAWWFLDQEDGMRKQLNTLSSFGLLSRFVGMLTDSRSFLSYPRHDYFRRILCDVLGSDIESGRLPRSEIAFIGEMVEDICYNNAKRYFEF